MNVLTKAETKPQTKPHPICHEYESPDLQNDILTWTVEEERWNNCVLLYFRTTQKKGGHFEEEKIFKKASVVPDFK